MRKNKRKTTKMSLLMLILLLGIGFAALTANLKINGTVDVSKASWDVHFENVQVTQGSVTATTAPTSDDTTTTEMTYAVSFTQPGDFYEFTVDMANDGSIDAMVNLVSNTIYESDGTTPKNLPSYLRSSVTYVDGVTIAQNQELLHNTSEKIKVRVEFRTDISASDLPSSADTIVFKFSGTFKQKDSNAVPVRVDFSTASWNQITTVYANNPSSLQETMENGDTKEIQMDIDNDGVDETYHLRIANISACTNEGTGSSCGFIIEFADIIDFHRYNPYVNNGNSNGDGNTGGWEYSELREYLNTTIYNRLPSSLKSVIIPTTVISGHGDRDNSNFETTDNLFLLDTVEVYGDSFEQSIYSQYNTAKEYERQLDYYRIKGVTITNNNDSKKQYNGSYSLWGLRSASSGFHHFFFAIETTGNIVEKDSESPLTGISPAFRIL